MEASIVYSGSEPQSCIVLCILALHKSCLHAMMHSGVAYYREYPWCFNLYYWNEQTNKQTSKTSNHHKYPGVRALFANIVFKEVVRNASFCLSQKGRESENRSHGSVGNSKQNMSMASPLWHLQGRWGSYTAAQTSKSMLFLQPLQPRYWIRKPPRTQFLQTQPLPSQTPRDREESSQPALPGIPTSAHLWTK